MHLEQSSFLDLVGGLFVARTGLAFGVMSRTISGSFVRPGEIRANP